MPNDQAALATHPGGAGYRKLRIPPGAINRRSRPSGKTWETTTVPLALRQQLTSTARGSAASVVLASGCGTKTHARCALGPPPGTKPATPSWLRPTGSGSAPTKRKSGPCPARLRLETSTSCSSKGTTPQGPKASGSSSPSSERYERRSWASRQTWFLKWERINPMATAAAIDRVFILRHPKVTVPSYRTSASIGMQGKSVERTASPANIVRLR